jgi:hypothetical protein
MRWMIGSLVLICGTLTACAKEAPRAPESRIATTRSWTYEESRVPGWRPLKLAAGHSTLFVLDPGGRHVLAIDAASGRLRWDVTFEPSFSLPRALAATGGDELLVADFLGREIIRLDSGGRIKSKFSFYAPILGMCVVSEEETLLLTTALPEPIILVDSAFRIRRRRLLPWNDLVDALPDKFDGGFDRSGNQCIYSVSRDHVAMWRGDSLQALTLPPDPLREEPFSFSTAGAGNSELIIASHLASVSSRLDHYSLADLKYQRTVVLEPVVIALVVLDSTYFAIVEEDHKRRVIAFRLATGRR